MLQPHVEHPVLCKTRLAPSPTGALHLGNARTFLINWAMARQRGWIVVLRIEDLDGPRVKKDADGGAISDLTWLGMDWDEGPIYQRADLSAYVTALGTLQKHGMVYPCTCSRSEIRRAQSAPHGDEHELRYPGTCRNKNRTSNPPTTTPVTTTWRLVVPDEPVMFTDQFQGYQRMYIQQQVGDFVVATKAGLPAYQLAVVVDDARQGITDIVRADDLLRSTARQILLYDRLQSAADATALPRYWHVPLVMGPDGRRLAKRHGDTRIAWYRYSGVTRQRMIGLLAYWCNIIAQPTAMDSDAFCERFRIDKLSPGPITFTEQDHQWLMQS